MRMKKHVAVAAVVLALLGMELSLPSVVKADNSGDIEFKWNPEAFVSSCVDACSENDFAEGVKNNVSQSETVKIAVKCGGMLRYVDADDADGVPFTVGNWQEFDEIFQVSDILIRFGSGNGDGGLGIVLFGYKNQRGMLVMNETNIFDERVKNVLFSIPIDAGLLTVHAGFVKDEGSYIEYIIEVEDGPLHSDSGETAKNGGADGNDGNSDKLNGQGFEEVLPGTWGYDSLSYISDKYLLAEKNGKFFVIDYEGEKIPEEEFTYGEGLIRYEAVISNEWDGAYVDFPGGYFAPYVEDERFSCGCYSYLIDSNLNVLCSALGQIAYCEDGMIAYESGDNLRTAFAEDDYSTCAEHCLVDVESMGNGYEIEKGCFKLSDEAYVVNMPCKLDVSDKKTEATPLLEGDEAVFDEYYAVQFMDDSCVSVSGWCAAAFGDVDETDEANANVHCSEMGFYNVLTDEYYVLTESEYIANMQSFIDENGYRCSASEYLAAVGTVEDFFESGKVLMRLIDLRTGDFASEKKYQCIELAGNDKLRVQREDGKWGYIDVSAFADGGTIGECGKWYSGASPFCNGYACVKSGAKWYAIDENFRKVSDGFDAISVRAAWAGSQGHGIFFVNDGKKERLLVVR